MFLDALLSDYQRRYALKIVQGLRALDAEQRHGVCGDATVHVLTWTPDPATLLRLHRKIRDVQQTGGLVLVYPGHGFLPTEEDALDKCLGDQVCLESYEQFLERIDCATRPAARRPPVSPSDDPFGGQPALAISAGDAPDLAALGFDATGNSAHLDEFVGRITRAVFAARCRLVYGGILRPSPNFTELLLDATSAYFVGALGPKRAVSSPTTPLENIQSWPFHLHATPEIRAMHHGMCSFHAVPPPGWRFEDLSRDQGSMPAEDAAWATGAGLSRMRILLARRTGAALLLAGKMTGWSGFLPGVAEELLTHTEAAFPEWPADLEEVVPLDDAVLAQRVGALEKLEPGQVRVVPLAEYGGVVRQMVRAILDPSGDRSSDAWKQLSFGNHRDHEGNRPFRLALKGATPDQHRWVEQRYELLRAALTGLWEIARLDPQVPLDRLGLTVEQWRDLMQSKGAGRVRRAIEKQIGPTLG